MLSEANDAGLSEARTAGAGCALRGFGTVILSVGMESASLG